MITFTAEEIQAWQIIGFEISGTVQTRSNGIAEAGKIYTAPDGERFFYAKIGSNCIYILVKAAPGNESNYGKVFQQDQFAFAEDISRHGTAADIGRRTVATKNVLEGWLDIYLGVLSCTGGPLAMAITGMNMVVLGGKIKQNYQIYFDASVELVVARKFCRSRMPVFYRTVLLQLIFGQYENWAIGKGKDLISDAIPGPKIAGKLVGVLLGKVGEDHLQRNLKAINGLLKEVLIKVAIHCRDKREKLSETQIEQLSKHVVTQLAPTGLAPSPTDAKEIIRETERHAISLPTMFKRISAAIDTLG